MQNISKKLIGVIVLVIALIAGGLFWQALKIPSQEKIAPLATESQNQQVVETQPQDQQGNEIDSIKDLIDGEYVFDPIDTSDWQTYRNEAMGFELKIPKNWYYSDENGGSCLRKVGKKYQAEMSENECAILISTSDRYSNKRLDFHEYIVRRKQGYNESIKTLNIDDLKSVVILGIGSIEMDAFRNQKAWVISSSYITDSNVMLAYSALLQTFKFID